MSLHDIFATQHNIAVFGEAGAGKTTALQMYAMRRMKALPSTPTLYVLLGQLGRVWQDKNILVKAEGLPDIEEGIAAYFNSYGASVDATAIRSMLKRDGSAVLFDGIDEAIKTIPWLVTSLESFAHRNPKVQVIVSARTYTQNLDNIPFFGITILPFTCEQLYEFFDKWFGDSRQASVTRLRKHLKDNPQLLEIVTNPLLATVLCTLEENGVPLPDSEVTLS